MSGSSAQAASGSARDEARGWLALICAGAIACASCSDGAQGDPPEPSGGSSGGCPSDLPRRDACEDVPSYRLDAAPIIEARCGSCHFPGNTQSGKVFESQGDIFPQRQTVLTRVYACAMPPPEAPALSAAERATLLSWLVCGAPDN